jgi:hypothetical protein
MVKKLDYNAVVKYPVMTKEAVFQPCVICGAETRMVLNKQVTLDVNVILGWEHLPICSEVCENLQYIRGFYYDSKP